MSLVQGIADSTAKRTIVGHLVGMLNELGVAVIAEGIETAADYTVLRRLGITLMQGFFFAHPALENLPEVTWPD